MSESFATPWTLDQQVPLSTGVPRQKYWSVLPFPPPWDLPNPGMEPMSLVSPALAGGFFTTSTTWETLYVEYIMRNARLDESQTGIKLAGEISITSDMRMTPP